MKINKAIVKRLIICFFITILYPYYKYVSTSNFVMFCDAFTFEGLTILVIGLIKKLFDSGAFKSTSYIIQRNFFKYNKTYDAYLEDTKASKSFNYAIYLGLADILISLLLSFLA